MKNTSASGSASVYGKTKGPETPVVNVATVTKTSMSAADFDAKTQAEALERLRSSKKIDPGSTLVRRTDDAFVS